MTRTERISILKFGGTPLSTEEGRSFAASHVMDSVKVGYRTVVVVSAMGRSGDPYSTDTLMSLIGTECSLQPRDLDLLVSCGETISSVIFSAKLNRLGIKAAPLTGGMAGIITDSNFGDASIVKIRKARLLEFIRNGIVPVVSGFQGTTLKGEITTLGRGGSDTTAIAIGSELKADRVCIYKDVDGVMTCDPKVSKDARLLVRISAQRLLEMVDSGSRIIHRKALELAIANKVVFIVRNTFPSSTETVVYPTEDQVSPENHTPLPSDPPHG
ncbi:MAG: aspartate kinase [Thermoplasmataceae archaeon]